MRALRAVRSMLFGETWALPLGIGAVVAIAAISRHADWFEDVGGLAVTAALTVVLALVVLRK